jgi:vacuolar protein sorting-associated protein 26
MGRRCEVCQSDHKSDARSVSDSFPVLVGETIPIRLFLGGFELTPTFRDVNKKFSTRYYLNLVLIDEENRRYFKQQVSSSALN